MYIKANRRKLHYCSTSFLVPAACCGPDAPTALTAASRGRYEPVEEEDMLKHVPGWTKILVLALPLALVSGCETTMSEADRSLLIEARDAGKEAKRASDIASEALKIARESRSQATGAAQAAEQAAADAKAASADARAASQEARAASDKAGRVFKRSLRK
jgi:hypothetical protein